MAEISDLLGKTITKFVTSNYQSIVEFYCSDETVYVIKNIFIYLEKTFGDVNNLIDSPILQIKEIVNEFNYDINWKFYKFKTQKGEVIFSWYNLPNNNHSIDNIHNIIKNSYVDLIL